VLDWRLHQTNPPNQGCPLPWLPGIPDRIAADPRWGLYLNARSQLVAELADQVRLNAASYAPAWAAQLHALVSAELTAGIPVWRAANHIDPSDLRPTGPPQHGRATQAWQQQVDKRLAAAARTEWRWRQLLTAEAPTTTADSFLPQLTERLSNLSRAGFDATLLVRSATAAGPLPDDHPAAALWCRILDQLPPQVPNQGSRIPNAVTASRNIRTRSQDHESPRPNSAPPPAFGPSR
jgi:hypothetical protein